MKQIKIYLHKTKPNFLSWFGIWKMQDKIQP